MLLSEEVMVTINYKNIERYLKLGYKFDTFINKSGKLSVRRDTKISVYVKDLDVQSGSIIRYSCDYCDTIIEIKYSDYMRHYQDGIKNDKDCCKKCTNKKVIEKLEEKYGEKVTSPYSLKSIRDKRDETVKNKYGVENIFEVKEVKEKIKETNLEKYGVEFYTQTDEYKERYKNTCIEKYGVDNVSKSNEIIEKIKNVQFERYGDYYSNTEEGKEKLEKAILKKYGVKNAFQNEDVKLKIKRTMLERYGVEHIMKIPEVAKETTLKSLETKSKMGNLPSSRQQEYLHKIFGGKKNYVVDNCALDIAFPEDMVYIEYDGSGHDLSVKLGSCTEEDFLKKEIKRKYFLKSEGWREIRIISSKDYIPSDDELNNILNYSLDWFNKNHNWIKFNIDNNTVETSDGVSEYNFIKLRKIKEDDLESAV